MLPWPSSTTGHNIGQATQSSICFLLELVEVVISYFFMQRAKPL
jgi:hypothetical protein